MRLAWLFRSLFSTERNGFKSFRYEVRLDEILRYSCVHTFTAVDYWMMAVRNSAMKTTTRCLNLRVVYRPHLPRDLRISSNRPFHIRQVGVFISIERVDVIIDRKQHTCTCLCLCESDLLLSWSTIIRNPL
jgi:hypothetical protein